MSLGSKLSFYFLFDEMPACWKLMFWGECLIQKMWLSSFLATPKHYWTNSFIITKWGLSISIHMSPTLFFSQVRAPTFPPKSAIWASMYQRLYEAHNRNNKGQSGNKQRVMGKTCPEYSGPPEKSLDSSLSSFQPKEWPLPRVISVMLDALRFKSINNKVNDYHLCPVINLLFLPWRKLSCSLLLWSSNLSSSQTKFWGKIAKPLQYGILWEMKCWQLRRLAPSNSEDSRYPRSQ